MKRLAGVLLAGSILLTGCTAPPTTSGTNPAGAKALEQVVVPDIRDLPANEALEVLNDINLDLRAIDDEEDRIVGRLSTWQVVSQTPKPGATVDAGTTVDGYVLPTDPAP